MSADLAAAFQLLYAFRAGELDSTPVTEKHAYLVRLASEDLGLRTANRPFEELVCAAAATDSEWNKTTQLCASDYYSLFQQGNIHEANLIRAKFLSSCPSVWYRGIIEAL